jgi:hypothetical protein
MKKLFVLLLSINLLSCNDRNDLVLTTPQGKEVSEFALSIAEAKDVLINFINNQAGTKSSIDLETKNVITHNFNILVFENEVISSTAATKETIIPVYEFSTKIEGKEGYTLVLGDKRIQKVLAFIEGGSLVDTANITGLNCYFKDIPLILEQDLKQYYSGVKNYTLRMDVLYKECLVPTIWSQFYPYNAACPTVCSKHNSSTCLNKESTKGRCKAGCVPIAIAQVMAYHKKPANLNWNIILSNSKLTANSSSTAISQASNLIAAIGNKCSVDYGCEEGGSGVLTSSTNTVVPQTFTDYKYIFNSWINSFNFTEITNSIVNKRPVYMQGITNDNKGHAWVCDGWKQHDYGDGAVYDYLRMNWGWNGLSDGYFYIYSSPSFYAESSKGWHLFNWGFNMLTNIR